MAVRTSSSSRTNSAAQVALALGALALVALPATVAASTYVPSVPLLRALYGGVPAAFVLGALAVTAARRARRTIALTLGRAPGENAAKWGRRLAFAGFYVGAMGAIAIASYTVLRLYSG